VERSYYNYQSKIARNIEEQYDAFSRKNSL